MNVVTLDLGGTNPRIAMIADTIISQKKVDVRIALSHTINTFLAEMAEQGRTTNVCVIAVAGPVENNRCKNPTNFPLTIDGTEIRENSLLEHVIVINDFEAVGYGVLSSHIQTLEIKAGSGISNNQKAVIGPGTGLGVSYMKNGLLQSEGGHMTLPLVEKYFPLYHNIAQSLGVHILDTESLVSGKGIVHIWNALETLFPQYAHLAEAIFGVGDDVVLDAEDLAASIAKYYGVNQRAHVTMKIFFELFGYAAQNVALNGLCYDGLYIAGGITIKDVAILEKSDFITAFTDTLQPNMVSVLTKIPIYLITDYDVSLYGCAIAAEKLLSNNAE